MGLVRTGGREDGVFAEFEGVQSERHTGRSVVMNTGEMLSIHLVVQSKARGSVQSILRHGTRELWVMGQHAVGDGRHVGRRLCWPLARRNLQVEELTFVNAGFAYPARHVAKLAVPPLILGRMGE
jgi:hypothetical protein